MSRRQPLKLTLLFGAGLVAGLSHFWATTVVLTVSSIVAGRHRWWLLVAFAGVVSGLTGQLREAASCRARLTTGVREHLLVTLDPPRKGHRRIRVRLPDAPCSGSVMAQWPRSATDSIGWIRVTARWVPREPMLGRAGGTLVVEQVLEIVGRPPLAVRLRRWIMDTVARLYGARGPVINALILNRKDGIDPAVREGFVLAGLVHLLAISGFHVGVVTMWVVVGCRLLRLRRAGMWLVATGAVFGYVALLGWPPAATRAGVLACLMGWSRVRQRHVAPATILATTVLVLLLAAPWTIGQVGAWLSVVALIGIFSFDRWGRRVMGGGRLVRSVAASIGATLATAPITATVFGTVSFVGVFLNLVAMPLAALALPAVLGSLLLAPVLPPVSHALAASGGALLGALLAVAEWGSGIEGGALVVAPGIGAGLPWVLGLALALWLIGRRNTPRETARRALWLLVAASWVLLLRPGNRPDQRSGLTLHFLDVKQGDGLAIQTPEGKWVLVDGGPRTGRWDAGRSIVVPFLRRHGVRRLAAIVMSHADADHLGGIPSVVEAIPTSLVVEPAAAPGSQLYLAFLDELAVAGVPWRPGRRGDRFVVDGVDFRVLHPDTSWAGWGRDINEDSVVLLVSFGDFDALLAGDIGFPAERELLGAVGHVEVLKVGHHGSDGSTGEAWLEELAPAAAIVSVGPNRYGHPSVGAMKRLAGSGAHIWRTDHEGHITIRTDGHTFEVTGRTRRETARAVP